jgi:hypothetical protein
MPGVALIAYFDGDAADLATRFHTAAGRYADSSDATQPTTAVLLRGRDGIAVVLVWPEGASLQPFRTFLQSSLAEFRLPHPRVEHFRAHAVTWDAVARTG